MGLFTNSKKTCPICNGSTPRFFAASIEGMPICKECSRKVDLPDGMLNTMTLADFRLYMDFYNENKRLRDIFTEQLRLVPGYAADNLLLDTANGLFRLKDEEMSLVFGASNLVSFHILEDNTPIFESVGDVLKCHKTDIPEHIRSLSALITQIAMQQQINEQMEQERQREMDIELPIPLKSFYVELAIDHPYWKGFRGELKGPRFKRDNPSVDEYLQEYRRSIGNLHKIAASLMQMIHPGAREVYDGRALSVSENDPIGEIKRYKDLMDAGAITTEEFAAKKRQILGI